MFTLFLQLLNVQVPFLFKYAVDFLNNLDSAALVQTAGGTTFTVLTALLLGCKYWYKKGGVAISQIQA